MRRVSIAPSILTADFASLGADVASVTPLVDWFHLDVMDGHYVPNLTFGPDVVRSIRRHTELPFHVHLMIQEPLKYCRRFAEAGAQRISFHPEVTPDVGAAIDEIKACGAEVGLAIHPDTAIGSVERFFGDVAVILVMSVRPGFGGQKFIPDVLPKIEEARRLVEERSLDADIEVDGGVNQETVERVVSAGANIVVAGSAIFDGVDAPAAARRLRHRLDELVGASS